MGFSVYDVTRVVLADEEIDDTYIPDTVINLSVDANPATAFLTLLARSSDTVDRLLDLHAISYFEVDDGVICSVNLPAGAGCGAVAPVDVLAAIPTTPAGLLLLAPMKVLAISLPVAPASGKVIHIHAVIGQF